MHRTTVSPAAVLLILSSAWLHAAVPPNALPLAPGYWARFDDRGEWRLESDRGPLLVHCGLRVWAKTGYLKQAQARVAKPTPRAAGAATKTFHGTLRAASGPIHYWQTATPVPKGLLVQYAISAKGLADTDRIAAGFDLPVATFQSATGTLSGGKPVTFPRKKAPEPRLIENDTATGLTVRRDGFALAFQRRSTGKIIVQDARPWHRPYFQALLYAGRGVGDPEGWRSVSFLLTLGEPVRAPVIAAVVPGRGELPCYDIHEAELRFWAPYDNPYLPSQVRAWAEVRTPSRRRYQARAFFTRDYRRSLADGTEQLAPRGHARWRLRIAPAEPGIHRYIVHVATPGGTASAEAISFTATPASPAKGFLHPPTRQSRYLELSDGRPCFLIGHNYCWPPPKTRTYAVDAALNDMRRSGINATRLWLVSWGIAIEGTRPDDYRLDDAWRLDHILQRARDEGIRVQLCLDNFSDLSAEEYAANNPYLARNGGPCARPEQFFSAPKAREQYRRRLDYLIARFAPFASLLAWELCSELDYATANRRDPALLTWTRESAAYLKKHDPHRHVVTTSLGLGSAWDDLWKTPQLDMVQAHAYIHRPVWVKSPHELDAAALILDQTKRFATAPKPFLIAEFGFLGTKDVNPLNDADRTGIHLHNAIWAAALSGNAGTPMNWWWEAYIAKNKLTYHHAALAKFLRAENLGRARWTLIRDKGKGTIRVLGLKSRTEALLWIQHRDNRWYRRLVERRQPVPLSATLLDLSRFVPGRYRVEWWDTYAGQPITHGLVVAKDGLLTLRIPPGQPDIACKVRRVSD